MEHQIQRSTNHSWAFFSFLYAVICAIVLIGSFLFYNQLTNLIGTDFNETIVRGIWFSMLAGGIGGVIGIVYSLYWHTIVA